MNNECCDDHMICVNAYVTMMKDVLLRHDCHFVSCMSTLGPDAHPFMEGHGTAGLHRVPKSVSILAPINRCIGYSSLVLAESMEMYHITQAPVNFGKVLNMCLLGRAGPNQLGTTLMHQHIMQKNHVDDHLCRLVHSLSALSVVKLQLVQCMKWPSGGHMPQRSGCCSNHAWCIWPTIASYTILHA